MRLVDQKSKVRGARRGLLRKQAAGQRAYIEGLYNDNKVDKFKVPTWCAKGARNTVGELKGPATTPTLRQIAAPPSVVHVLVEGVDPRDAAKADPSCKCCHGTGRAGVVVVQGKDRKAYHGPTLLCACVRKSERRAATRAANQESDRLLWQVIRAARG